jgi:hypothetical protein
LLRGKRCRPRPSGTRCNSTPPTRSATTLNHRGGRAEVCTLRRSVPVSIDSETRGNWTLLQALRQQPWDKARRVLTHTHKAAASSLSGGVGGETCAVTYHGRDRGKNHTLDQRMFRASPDLLLPRSSGIGLESRYRVRRGLPRLIRCRDNTLGPVFSRTEESGSYGRLLITHTRTHTHTNNALEMPDTQKGRHRPVLKHGPRSLTSVRVAWS